MHVIRHDVIHERHAPFLLGEDSRPFYAPQSSFHIATVGRRTSGSTFNKPLLQL